MTRTIPAVCVGLTLAGLSMAAAQNPATQSGSSQARGSSVTLTGCVKPWDGATTMPGGSSTSSRSSMGGPMYALTDVERSSASATGSAGSTSSTSPGSTSPGAMSGAMQSTYLLHSTDSSVNLSQHVNHKVAITGMVSDSSGSMSNTMPGSSSAGSPSTGTTGTSGSTGAGTPGAGSTGTTGASGTSGRTSGATGTPGTPGSQSSPNSTMGSNPMPQTLTISSVQMISATCSSGN